MKNAGTRSSSTAATIFAARAPEFYLFHNQPANKIVDGAGRGVIGIKIDTPALLPAALGLSPRVSRPRVARAIIALTWCFVVELGVIVVAPNELQFAGAETAG